MSERAAGRVESRGWRQGSEAEFVSRLLTLAGNAGPSRLCVSTGSRGLPAAFELVLSLTPSGSGGGFTVDACPP